MKIEREKKQMVELGEMKFGECFLYEGDHYIVTREGDSTIVVAVSLSSGYIGRFAIRTKVIPIDAKVVVG